MKYVYRETELSKKYQNIYLNARKDGNEILCYIGIDKRYRIYTKDSYYENISDMDALLELCIYPIYINGCHPAPYFMAKRSRNCFLRNI